MPRKAREKGKSGIYHIIIRGLNGEDIFREKADKEEFLKILKVCKNSEDLMIFSYILFDDHMHLLLKEGPRGMANALKHVSTKYVRWYNSKYKFSGKLFHDRYLSEPVDSEEYLMKAIRYIINNRSIHQTEKNAPKYLWSAYDEYIKADDEILDVEVILGLLSENTQEGISFFKAYLDIKNSDAFLEIGTERIILNDESIRRFIKEKYGIKDGILTNVPKEELPEILTELKKVRGISIRRLANATGLSKFTVEKA